MCLDVTCEGVYTALAASRVRCSGVRRVEKTFIHHQIAIIIIIIFQIVNAIIIIIVER